jgi:hypothetical protein
VGRKWSTKKSRRDAKKKAAARSRRQQQPEKMAPMSSSIISPMEVNSLAASASYLPEEKRAALSGLGVVASASPGAFGDYEDELSLASSGEGSTVGPTGSVGGATSYLEQQMMFEGLNVDGEEEDRLMGSMAFDEASGNEEGSTGTNARPDIGTKPLPPIPKRVARAASPATSPAPAPATSLAPAPPPSLNQTAPLSPISAPPPEYFDDPTLDAPVNLTITCATSAGSAGSAARVAQTVGKMIVMKKSPLAKIRALLAKHYSDLLPSRFYFLGDPGHPADHIDPRSESFVLVSDVSVFTSFSPTGLACMDLRLRPKHKRQLPFSQCANVEDFIRVSKEESFLDRRMKEAHDCGAAAVLGKLEGFIRKYQMRLSDVFHNVDTSGDGSLTGEELREALASIKCVIAPEKMDALVSFLDDSGDGEVDARELEEALRQFRRSQKNNEVKGIYVSDSIKLTRRAVKQLWSSNDAGIPVSPRSKRLGVLLDPINALAKPRGPDEIARALEGTMQVMPRLYEDYVEQVSLGGSAQSSVVGGKPKKKQSKHR